MLWLPPFFLCYASPPFLSASATIPPVRTLYTDREMLTWARQELIPCPLAHFVRTLFQCRDKATGDIFPYIACATQGYHRSYRIRKLHAPVTMAQALARRAVGSPAKPRVRERI